MSDGALREGLLYDLLGSLAARRREADVLFSAMALRDSRLMSSAGAHE